MTESRHKVSDIDFRVMSCRALQKLCEIKARANGVVDAINATQKDEDRSLKVFHSGLQAMGWYLTEKRLIKDFFQERITTA